MNNSPSQPSEEEIKERHARMSKKEYFSAFAEAPEDLARVLHVLENDDGEAVAFPQKDGMVWLRVDKIHELYLKMDPELAAVVGTQMILAAGVAEVIRSKTIHVGPKEKTDAQNQAADQGSEAPPAGD